MPAAESAARRALDPEGTGGDGAGEVVCVSGDGVAGRVAVCSVCVGVDIFYFSSLGLIFLSLSCVICF